MLPQLKWILSCLALVGIVFQVPLAAYPQSVSEQGLMRGIGGDRPDRNLERTVSVHVFGEVEEPGTYLLRPADRLLAAIQLAGGVTDTGSLTRVELRRSGKAARVVDILKLKRGGDLSMDPFLQENDVIFVPRMQKAVAIQGSVHYPGVYEISDQASINSLVEMAGDFTTGFAKKVDLTVIRFNDNGEKDVFKVPSSEAALKDFRLINGDTVVVPHVFIAGREFSNSVNSLPNDNLSYPSYNKEVYVVGGVNKPGKYEFNPQHHLATYVAEAGGQTRLGRNNIKVIRGTENFRTSLEDSEFFVSPGDTLIVDEAKIPPEFWISLMVSLATLGVTSYSILR